jgi:hypothetical protein
VDSGEKNKVLPEGPYSGCTVSRPDVWLLITRHMYAPEPRRTVTMWQGNPIFAKCPIAHVFLDLGLLC